MRDSSMVGRSGVFRSCARRYRRTGRARPARNNIGSARHRLLLDRSAMAVAQAAEDSSDEQAGTPPHNEGGSPLVSCPVNTFAVILRVCDFLIPCPFPIPLPVQGEGKRAGRARVRAVATSASRSTPCVRNGFVPKLLSRLRERRESGLDLYSRSAPLHLRRNAQCECGLRSVSR